MYVVGNFESMCGIPHSTWNYLEVGHGKGPCDGLGGIAKRNADNAIKQGKISIQNAFDFKEWGSAIKDTKIKYYLYSGEEVQAKKTFLEELNPKPIKNTMLIHTVSSFRQGEVHTRETSCFCNNCFTFGLMTCMCPGWTIQTIGRRNDDVPKPKDDDEIKKMIKKGTIISVYTDQEDQFYLLKSKKMPEVLDRTETDDWGNTYHKNDAIVRGWFYSKDALNLNVYNIVLRKIAFVPVASVIYATNNIAPLNQIKLSSEDVQEILEMVEKV